MSTLWLVLEPCGLGPSGIRRPAQSVRRTPPIQLKTAAAGSQQRETKTRANPAAGVKGHSRRTKAELRGAAQLTHISPQSQGTLVLIAFSDTAFIGEKGCNVGRGQRRLSSLCRESHPVPSSGKRQSVPRGTILNHPCLNLGLPGDKPPREPEERHYHGNSLDSSPAAFVQRFSRKYFSKDTKIHVCL